MYFRRICNFIFAASAVFLMGTAHYASLHAKTVKTPPNVLLICVDDLKPVLGCYGDTLAQTPHMDRLAERGMRFERAYCNQAVCAPSRNSLMTGARPTTIGVYSLGMFFRKAAPEAVTMSQHFMRHGWHTEAVGKIFHTGHGNQDDAASWSVPYEPVSGRNYVGTKRARGPAWENADVPDNAYRDGCIAEEGIRRLKAAAKKPDQPFFLAVGFVKPHLPFCAPKKYWDLYDPASFSLASRQAPPVNAPEVAGKGVGEISSYDDIPDHLPFEKGLQRKLIHGYYAAVSYVDAQIGHLLDALDQLQLADNTVIVLWGDHGFHLGDLSYWTKHTNYEQANRIPIIIVAPGVTTAGTKTLQLAETVDIYPTLADLAGIGFPQVPQHIDGVSLVPVLGDPSARVRDHVYHAYPRGDIIGRAIRTDRYRMVEWKIPGQADQTAVYELYDYKEDLLESINLADSKPDILAELCAILAQHPEAKPEYKPKSD